MQTKALFATQSDRTASSNFHSAIQWSLLIWSRFWPGRYWPAGPGGEDHEDILGASFSHKEDEEAVALYAAAKTKQCRRDTLSGKEKFHKLWCFSFVASKRI